MKKILLLVCMLLVFCNVAYANEDRWQWICSDDEYSFFFDTATIKYGTCPVNSGQKNCINVWVKMVYTWESIQKIASICKDNDSVNLNIRYSLNEWEINPNDGTFLRIGTTYYDKDGHVAETFTFNSKWDHIIPGTRGESIYNAIVQYARNFPSVLKSHSY